MTEARASQQLAWRRMWERSSKSILGVAGILPMSDWGYVIGANDTNGHLLHYTLSTAMRNYIIITL